MKISNFARKSKSSKHLDIPFLKICDIVATTVHTAVFTFTFSRIWQFFSKFDFDFYHTESQSKKAKVIRNSKQNFKEEDFSLYKGNASEIHSVNVEKPTKQHQH